jgi:quercetin dioxygenase-like cupin family protein
MTDQATGAAIVERVGDCDRIVVDDRVELASWNGAGFSHDGVGTAYVVAIDATHVSVAHGNYPIPPFGYAALPTVARLDGGRGVVVTHRGSRGLFQIGGPVEPAGRLRYIDGCTDTVLIAPVVCGDPCLNLLHLPTGTRQSAHQHPSVRVGLVLGGSGTCVLDDSRRVPMSLGTWFVLPAGTTHRFETGADDDLLVVAWHPDSDTGPTDDDHPMLNRTILPRSTPREGEDASCAVRPAITTSATAQACGAPGAATTSC